MIDLRGVDLPPVLPGLDGTTLSADERLLLGDDQASVPINHEVCHIDVKACTAPGPDGQPVNVARIVIHVTPFGRPHEPHVVENAALMADSLYRLVAAGMDRIKAPCTLHLAPYGSHEETHRIVATVPTANLLAIAVEPLALAVSLVREHPSDFINPGAIEPEDVEP